MFSPNVYKNYKTVNHTIKEVLFDLFEIKQSAATWPIVVFPFYSLPRHCDSGVGVFNGLPGQRIGITLVCVFELCLSHLIHYVLNFLMEYPLIYTLDR